MEMGGVNLIPAKRQQAGDRRRRVRKWTWGIVTYGVLLVVGCAVCATAMSAESDETSAALEKTLRQIEDLNRTAVSLRPQLGELQARLAVAHTIGDQPDWSLLLALVGSCLDDDVVLSATKLEPQPSNVAAPQQPLPTSRPTAPGSKAAAKVDSPPELLVLALQGMGRSQGAVTQFVLRLERLGLFERVTILNSARQTLGTGETNSFRLECVLRRNPAQAGGNSR